MLTRRPSQNDLRQIRVAYVPKEFSDPAIFFHCWGSWANRVTFRSARFGRMSDAKPRRNCEISVLRYERVDTLNGHNVGFRKLSVLGIATLENSKRVGWVWG